MKLDEKTNVELVLIREQICINPINKSNDNNIYIYTAKARKKLDLIDRAITNNIRVDKLAAGIYINDAGYSGRNTKRNRG